MSELTGLDPLEVAVLETLVGMGAGPDRPHLRCLDVTAECERRFGFGPAKAYDTLLGLAQPWLRWLPLVDGHGNFGAPGWAAAEQRYTEARLTKVGAAAASAETEAGPALPLGLVEGTFYRGGIVMPAGPPALDALLALARDPGICDDELLTILGSPSVPSGSRAAVADGAVVLTADVARRVDGDLEITNLPPGESADSVINRIAGRARQLHLRDVNDLSRGREQRVLVRPGPTADVDELVNELRQIWGVHVIVRARPLEIAAVRGWFETYWIDATANTIALMKQELERRNEPDWIETD